MKIRTRVGLALLIGFAVATLLTYIGGRVDTGMPLCNITSTEYGLPFSHRVVEVLGAPRENGDGTFSSCSGGGTFFSPNAFVVNGIVWAAAVFLVVLLVDMIRGQKKKSTGAQQTF